MRDPGVAEGEILYEGPQQGGGGGGVAEGEILYEGPQQGAGSRGGGGVAEGEILYEGPQQGAGSIPSGFAAVLVSQSAVEISPYDDGHCAV